MFKNIFYIIDYQKNKCVLFNIHLNMTSNDTTAMNICHLGDNRHANPFLKKEVYTFWAPNTS